MYVTHGSKTKYVQDYGCKKFDIGCLTELCHKSVGKHVCETLWLTKVVGTDGFTVVYVKGGIVQVWERWRLTNMVDKNVYGRWWDGGQKKNMVKQMDRND